MILAQKIDVDKGAQLQLKVADMDGDETSCDPVLALAIRETGKPVSETFTNIPQAESNITCDNGDPGLRNLLIDVNGTRFRLAGLKDNEETTLDVSSAMVEGNNNTITLTAYGKPGTSAVVVISD